MDSSDWEVHKFGGTSLADAARIARAARLIDDAHRAAPGTGIAVVVSAMAGVTNDLIAAVEAAATGGAWSALASGVLDRYRSAARELLEDDAAPLLDVLATEAADVEDVLRGLRVARSVPGQTRDLVAGYGELWSARLFCARLARIGLDAVWLDARDVLRVQRDETGPVVLREDSAQRLSAWRSAHPAAVLVIPGYVASDAQGVPTTLERNGSDYSAAIFAALLSAKMVTIWTDVDGVMSADPRRVPEARVLPELSHDEAMELAYFGAKVLHPQTMTPVVAGGIPIWIRNALRPDAPGTRIGPARGEARATTAREAVKGLSCIDDVVLLNVEGAGMIGVPGVASRLFAALREVGVSVVMISQASSEHSICVAIPAGQGAGAREAVRRAFDHELRHGRIQDIELDGPFSILAAVGDSMVETPGVAARLFGALASAGVNVRAVAQGSSERNLSVVVAARDSSRALRAAHAAFVLSDQTLSVGLVGPGLVGAELLDQLAAQAERLHADFQIDLRVRALAGSRRMVLADDGIDLARWRDELEARSVATDLTALGAFVRADHLPHAVILDCTASAQVTAHYAEWLERRIHVITPNKKANSAGFDAYRRLRELARLRGVQYRFEATVGAGLPVISTLRDLVQTGDRVLRIEGVLSGTLSYLFGELSPEQPFSAVVAEARRRGYTEPDPREDLAGMDVARKAVILAREIGSCVELGDIEIEDLAPAALRDCATVEEFLAGLPAHDAAMEERRAHAAARGEVLRHVACIEAGSGVEGSGVEGSGVEGSGVEGSAVEGSGVEGSGVEVGLRSLPFAHPFAALAGGDNIIAFTTERYREQPLVVRGPGAGPQVTAGGVFSDLLRLASHLGALS